MRLLHAAPLVLSLAAAGCASTMGLAPDPVDTECHDVNTPGCVVTSDQQRLTNPAVPTGDLEALVDGDTAFALALYQQIRGEQGNLFYSPHSMSIALAMTWAGARGRTEQDMAAALRFTLPQDRLHAAMNALDLTLARRGQGAHGVGGQGFRLNVANALWGQVGYHFEDPFLDTLAVNYGAGVHVVDFIRARTQALDLINGWVEGKTEGRIKDILQPENITGDTVLVLTNAVYFNAAWQTPFKEPNTAPAPFTTQAGAVVEAPMMHDTLKVPYGQGTGFAAVELPYDGRELSMVLVLPEDLGAFEDTLDAARLDQVLGSLSLHKVDLRLPKFRFESRFGMVEPLAALGMGVAFTPEADLSGINGRGGLWISDVIHQAFVSVNEAGTEAAAATAVVVVRGAAEPAQITFDRPFLFFIRDIATGAVLFVGRVSDPTR